MFEAEGLQFVVVWSELDEDSKMEDEKKRRTVKTKERKMKKKKNLSPFMSEQW